MRLNTLSPALAPSASSTVRAVVSVLVWARPVVVVLKVKPLVPVAARSATVSKAARCL